MKLGCRIAVDLVAGAALIAPAAPALADKPDGLIYSKQISLRDGSQSCGSDQAGAWNGFFNPGKGVNFSVNNCHLTGPRTTTVIAGAVRTP